MGGLSLEDDEIEKEWWAYLKGFRAILKTFRNNYQADAEAREVSRERGRGLRLFNLVPMSSHIPGHFQIDTLGLYYLIRLLPSHQRGLLLEQVQSEQANRIEALELPTNPSMYETHDWWNLLFKYRKYETASRTFSGSISTDGVRVSILMSKAKANMEPWVNDWGYGAEGIYHPYRILEFTPVVGLDPGRKALYTTAASSGAENIVGDIKSCSNERWHEISGSTAIRRKAALRNQSEFGQLMTTCPTSKVHDSESLFTHLDFYFDNLVQIIDYYHHPPWRKDRWTARIKKQKAYDVICKEITNDEPSCVVAYGGGSFRHNSRGHLPTPNKHLFVELKRRNIRVRLAPEYLTSQICSLCDVRTYQHNNRRTYGLKNCRNQNCLMLWNRDVNAARNIRRGFIHINANGGGRLPVFQSRYQRSIRDVNAARNTIRLLIQINANDGEII